MPTPCLLTCWYKTHWVSLDSFFCFTFYLQSISKFCLFIFKYILHAVHMSSAHCWFTGPAHLHSSSCRRQWPSYPGSPLSCFMSFFTQWHFRKVSAPRVGAQELPAHLGLTLKSAVWPPGLRQAWPRYFPSLYSASSLLSPSLCRPVWLFSSFWPWLWLHLEYLPLIILCLAALLNFDFLSNVTSSEKCPRITPSRVFCRIGMFTHHSFEIITCPASAHHLHLDSKFHKGMGLFWHVHCNISMIEAYLVHIRAQLITCWMNTCVDPWMKKWLGFTLVTLCATYIFFLGLFLGPC